MGKPNSRLEAVRKAYREALDAARSSPTPENWGKLLAAGKDLSAAQEPKTRARRPRRETTPTYQDLEGPVAPAHESIVAPDIEQLD